MGPNDFYTMFKLQGRHAAAGCTLRPEERSHGVPPHWMIYIQVEKADAAAAKAQQLGGKVLAPAFDVMDAGRMAVVQDPTGASFCVWQVKKDTGIGIANVAGTLCWADLSTPDAKRASAFYSGLFGWQLTADPKDHFGLPAHQERRAFHRRHSARSSSPARSASALARLLPGG